MDSSLSKVPPENPNPRPLILKTGTPQAATKGAKIKVVVSATPPVECLSAMGPGKADKSTVRPERVISRVRQTVSSSVMPRQKMAISMALI